jgi:O-antigen ligase
MKEAVVATEANVTSNSNSSANERWLFAGLLTIVALAPLPLGSNRPLPMAILCLCSGFLLILWALLWNFKRASLHLHSNDIKWAVYGYGAVCLWVGFQWAPIMPTAFTDPVWQSTAKLLDFDINARLSVNPNATLTGLMHLLTYGGIFWLSFELTRTSERAWFAIRAIVWIGTVYAVYGIAIYMAGNDWIVIYPKWTYLDSLTSTFVNRNSYATFAGLTLLAAIAVFVRHMAPFFALKHPVRLKIVLIVEEVAARAAIKTFSIISIAVALLLSASRGGTGSTAIGLLVLGAIYTVRKRLKRRPIFGLILATTIAAIIIFTASGNHLSKRLPDNQLQASLDVRTDIFAITWDAIMSSPWKGTGFGTFEDVFPAYRQGNYSPLILWDKAHNTYLENALELGIPAALLLNFSIALIAIQCLRGALTRKRDRIIPALGVAASVLVGLHSLGDFSLQIPAVSILYAALMGVSVSQSWSQHQTR